MNVFDSMKCARRKTIHWAVLALVLSAAFIFACGPPLLTRAYAADASETESSGPSLATGLVERVGQDKYHQMTGTVYFSRSDDAAYCVSSGMVPNVVMADVPIDLAEVCQVDLDEYGLGKYKLAAPEGSGYSYECTVLQLMLYAAHLYASDEGFELGDTSAPRSLYFTRYWGDNYNFLYYVNGAYPIDYSLDPEGSQGATADAICLHDGGRGHSRSFFE